MNVIIGAMKIKSNNNLIEIIWLRNEINGEDMIDKQDKYIKNKIPIKDALI